jgi:hypothetical protein
MGRSLPKNRTQIAEGFFIAETLHYELRSGSPSG